MTRPEFDAWVEQHYGDLLAVAVRLTDCEPEDIVQAAVARMLKSQALANVVDDPNAKGQMGVWPWAVGCLRSTFSNRRTVGWRRTRVEKEVQAVASLGERGNLRTPPRPKCQ